MKEPKMVSIKLSMRKEAELRDGREALAEAKARVESRYIASGIAALKDRCVIIDAEAVREGVRRAFNEFYTPGGPGNLSEILEMLEEDRHKSVHDLVHGFWGDAMMLWEGDDNNVLTPLLKAGALKARKGVSLSDYGEDDD